MSTHAVLLYHSPAKLQNVSNVSNSLGCGLLTTKTRDKKNVSSAQKKEGAPQKDTLMRTAFIRVSKENMTGEDKSILVTYTKENIKKILDEWVVESGLTYWFIEHNPDEEDDNTHFHIVIRFKTNSRFSTIKNKFPFAYIKPIISTVKQTIQYLVHLNDVSKLAYKWEDIVTNGGDLTPYKVQSRSQQAVSMQHVCDMIKSGELTKLNIRDKVPMELYKDCKTQILNAFEYDEMKFHSVQERDIRVAFFFGENGGEGKTEFIKGYAERLGYTWFESSASNDPLQGYLGQDVLILDDLRDNAMKYQDMLKMLDNFTGSTIKSRYSNKLFTGKLIAITSNKSLYDWYSNITESKHPLYRRITDMYVFKNDIMYRYVYNKKSYRYEPHGHAPVPDWCKHEDSSPKNIDMFADLGISATLATDREKAKNAFDMLVNAIPEATEEEREARRLYEASLPPLNQENINKYRIG